MRRGGAAEASFGFPGCGEPQHSRAAGAANATVECDGLPPPWGILC